jgi:hypothetical protein
MLLEVVNFVLAVSFPIDIGLPDGTSFAVRILFSQALYMHYPAWLLLDWMDKFAHTVAWKISFSLALFVIGYLDTVLLLMALIFGFRLLRWLFRHSIRTEVAEY